MNLNFESNSKRRVGLKIKPKGFTFIEILVVMTLLVVIGAILILILNPAEYLKRTRDAKRLSDASILSLAMAHYNYSVSFNEKNKDEDGPHFPSSGVPPLPVTDSCKNEANPRIFVSVPSDNNEDSPVPDSPWVYSRVTSTQLKSVDGSGWLPIRFVDDSSRRAPISTLPVDPINSFSSGYYYSYGCGSWELNLRFESDKYRDLALFDNGSDDEVYEVGNDLNILPDQNFTTPTPSPFTTPAISPTPTPPLIVQTIDNSAYDVGLFTSIKLDSSGNAHISYKDESNLNLLYATNVSGTFTTTTVDSFHMVGAYSSIALDSNGKAHISYYNLTNNRLKYATNVSGAWVTTSVDASGNTGFFTSIAVDSNGFAHISYYDLFSGKPKYATNISGSWTYTTLEPLSSDSLGNYTSIALDSQNHVYISYHDITNNNLKYATNASGSWVYSTVDASGGGGEFSSIALDSNQKIHISYASGAYLKYATNSTGSWVISTLDSLGSYTSMALDTQNHVYISYYDTANTSLKYITNVSGVWIPSVLDSAGDMGQYSAIAVDTAGFAHISYHDNTNGNLKYAKVPPSYSYSPSCVGGSVVGGYCYYLGTNGNSCDTICSQKGLSCDASGLTYAHIDITKCSVVGNLLNSIGLTGANYAGTLGCSFNGSRWRLTNSAPICSAINGSNAPACACD